MLASAQSPESAIKVAKAGIDAMYKSFEFIGPDGSTMKFEEALKQGVNRFHTHTVVGSRRKNADNLKNLRKLKLKNARSLNYDTKTTEQKWKQKYVDKIMQKLEHKWNQTKEKKEQHTSLK